MDSTAKSQEIVAAVLIAEAGGEGVQGMEAVYEIINNRSVRGKKSYEDVVTQPAQFSCLNGVTTDDLIAKSKQHPRWEQALQMVKSPPTTRYANGATHYYANWIKKTPKWAVGKTPVATLGKHLFFRI